MSHIMRPVLTAANGPMDATACIGAAAADIEATRQTAAGAPPKNWRYLNAPNWMLDGLVWLQCSVHLSSQC